MMPLCPTLVPYVQDVSFFAVHATSDRHIRLHTGSHIDIVLCSTSVQSLQDNPIHSFGSYQTSSQSFSQL